MKKPIFILGLLLSVVFLFAQNPVHLSEPKSTSVIKTETLQREIIPPSQVAPYENAVPANPYPKGAAKGNIFDGAEAHDDFAINSPGTVGWTYYENGGGTYTVDGKTFPNQGTNFAYIIFNPSQVQPSSMTGPAEPHVGSKYFACFSTVPPTQPNDHWIVSPQLDVANTFTFQFWAKSYTINYGTERIKVRYSTTTIDKESFTNYLAGSASAYISVPGDWAQYVYTVPPDAKYVAIQCVSDDAFFLMVDDIEIITESDCGPISNLTATYTPECDAELSWEGHADAISYEIYRDELPMETVTTTTYLDSGFDPQLEHSWKVVAVCNSGKSAPTITTAEQCANCPIISDIQVSLVGHEDDCDATLSWEEPSSLAEVEIYQCDYYADPNVFNVTGWDDDFDFTFAFRLFPSDLAELGIISGQVVTKVFLLMGFGLEYIQHMEIRIWEGGTHISDPGDLVYTQEVDFSELEEATGYWIDLDIPFLIDATKELRIGYQVFWPDNPDCAPWATDQGPANQGKGDLLNWKQGEYYVWNTLDYFLQNGDMNFYIFAQVEKGDATAPVWEYDIYRDGNLVIGNHTENSYIDQAVSQGNHNWMVKVDCLAGGQSVPAYESGTCVPDAINEPVKTGFSIQPNPAKDNIKITAENDFNQVEIVNFLGQTVLSQSNEGNISNVNVSNLSNGVYFIRIISNQATSIQKFVKQ